MYPIFYTPQQYNQQQSQLTQQPHSLPNTTQDGSGKVQDSPFAQKYQVVYPGPYTGGPNFVHQQYPYYVSSSPAQASQQYIIPPVVGQPTYNNNNYQHNHLLSQNNNNNQYHLIILSHLTKQLANLRTIPHLIKDIRLLKVVV